MSMQIVETAPVDNRRRNPQVCPASDPQVGERTIDTMAFEVTLADDTVEWVDGADSYQQEGPMTTFFGNDPPRPVLDCWSVKVASYRTDRIVRIRRHPSWGLE